MHKLRSVRIKAFCCISSAFLVLCLGGCGTEIAPPAEAVDVAVKLTLKQQPITNVTLTLQPIVAGGRQADISIVNGTGASKVTPGTYTYYVEKGKSEADLRKIPDDYRQGSLSRSVEISQSGTVDLNFE